MTQPALFALETLAPAEQEVCICCGALEAHIVVEGATYKQHDSGRLEPMVTVDWHCDACGENSGTLRSQESPWIRLLWKLPPPEPRKRRRGR